MKSLSERGIKASETVLRFDMEISMEAQANPYHPTDNPTGTFPLNIAENRLCWSELKSKFRQISASQDIPNWALGYTSPLGDMVFREALARFYKHYLTGVEVQPDHLACSPGATGIVEMTAFILADPGDVAAFPAPCYPVYRQDMGSISGIDRYDIVTHDNIDKLQDGPLLSIDHLEATKKDIESSGKKFKLLVITTPDNPTGQVYGQQQLEDIADWCIKERVHLIVNEIYALSLIDTKQSAISGDYKNKKTNGIFGKLMAAKQSDFLHHWYSFSKDFGISGFRVGVLYSLNELCIKAYQNLNLTHSVSNHTQWLLSEMISDRHFLDHYIDTNQERLTKSYISVIEMLRRVGLPYVPADGSLFVWIDMSHFLSENTQQAEEKLWSDIYNHTGVLLTPGHGFGHVGYGHFRLVYPYVSYADLTVALERLESYLKSV